MTEKYPTRIVKRASTYRIKALIFEVERIENEIEADLWKNDGHPWYPEDREVFYNLEQRHGYQLTAYHKDDGSRADCSYHKTICYCPECSYPIAVDSGDIQVCHWCEGIFTTDDGL